MYSTEIIKKPLITEKAARLASEGAYVFKVDVNASAAEIKKAIQGIYNVRVIKVNIARVKPRVGYFRGVPNAVRRAGYKKAMVTLKEGDSIDVIAH